MQSKSLSFQITNKGKKHMLNQEPTFFSEIPYSNVREINYLADLQQKKKNIDFPIFQFEKDFGNEAPINEYDMLADRMYKKIMQKGYLEQKKPVSKKKKKTKNPYEYDYEDVFINDEEVITIKKNAQLKYQNFKCLNQGIQQFYNSQLYKSNLLQLQQQSKKRTTDIKLDAQQLEQIKKKIKENINFTHNRAKQEIDMQIKTGFTENINNQTVLQSQKDSFNLKNSIQQDNSPQSLIKKQEIMQPILNELSKNDTVLPQKMNLDTIKKQDVAQNQQKKQKKKQKANGIQKKNIQKIDVNCQKNQKLKKPSNKQQKPEQPSAQIEDQKAQNININDLNQNKSFSNLTNDNKQLNLSVTQVDSKQMEEELNQISQAKDQIQKQV